MISILKILEQSHLVHAQEIPEINLKQILIRAGKDLAGGLGTSVDEAKLDEGFCFVVSSETSGRCSQSVDNKGEHQPLLDFCNISSSQKAGRLRISGFRKLSLDKSFDCQDLIYPIEEI